MDEPTQKFSYRKFGVAFLLLAIVVAIILAAVPAAVNNNNTLDNSETGYLYFALLAVFLILLLSCLFCTYYLGGSRDTWEDPVFSGIRFNFSNTTAIIGLFVEFIQVCGFSFHDKATFTGSDNFSNMLYPMFPPIVCTILHDVCPQSYIHTSRPPSNILPLTLKHFHRSCFTSFQYFFCMAFSYH